MDDGISFDAKLSEWNANLRSPFPKWDSTEARQACNRVTSIFRGTVLCVKMNFLAACYVPLSMRVQIPISFMGNKYFFSLYGNNSCNSTSRFQGSSFVPVFIEYFLFPLISLVSKSGYVFTSHPIDHEQKPEYVFRIVAHQENESNAAEKVFLQVKILPFSSSTVTSLNSCVICW